VVTYREALQCSSKPGCMKENNSMSAMRSREASSIQCLSASKRSGKHQGGGHEPLCSMTRRQLFAGFGAAVTTASLDTVPVVRRAAAAGEASSPVILGKGAGVRFFDQRKAVYLASSRLKLELERALSARRDEFEGRQLPIVGGVKPDLSNGSFADVEVAHPPILRSVQESSGNYIRDNGSALWHSRP
jgi:hypothetical protein